MKKIFIGIIIGSFLLVILSYIFYIRPNYYLFNGGEIKFSSEIRKELFRSQYVEMIPYRNALYFCSHEGFEKRQFNGQNEWTKPYQMTSPKMFHSGEYFAVVDILGHDAYIFNQNGFIGNIRENLPIISAKLNPAGQLVLVLESDLENRIKIYSKEGVALIERGSVLNQDGYPVTLDLSKNGMNLTTSYVDAFQGRLQTKLTMFGFDKYHEDLDEFIIRADTVEELLIPEVHYFDEKFLWCIGNGKAYVYSMDNSKKIYADPKEIDVNGDILKVCYTNQEVLIYFDTKQMGENRYQLMVYKINGELKKEFNFSDALELVTAQEDVYFIVNHEMIHKYKGKRLIWKYPFYESIDGFYQLEKNRYLLIQPMGYTVWKVKEIY